MEEEIKEAVGVLEEGGIIAFPTDTVFGLGGDAYSEKAIEALYRIKEREKEKPFVLFIPDKKYLNRFVQEVSGDAKRLVDAFWPGPLTLVFSASQEIPPRLNSKGTVGIRIPDEEIVLSLLHTYLKPLATTSANRSGSRPFGSSEEVRKQFGKEIGLVLRGELGDHRTPSTVLDVSQAPPVFLRKGRIPILSIERILKNPVKLGEDLTFNVLVVCTGNACRSPMALGLFRHRLPEKLRTRVISTSCGTGAFENEPATENAILASQENGVDISDHRSKSVTKFLIENADLILVMSPHHMDRILEISPEAQDKTHFLKNYGKELPLEEKVIEDPIGFPLNHYQKTIQIIDESLVPVIKEIEKRFS
jgi:L-threonylcarbamoyladenylate synthase